VVTGLFQPAHSQRLFRNGQRPAPRSRHPESTVLVPSQKWSAGRGGWLAHTESGQSRG
jgi:hypothetical protein